MAAACNFFFLVLKRQMRWKMVPWISENENSVFSSCERMLVHNPMRKYCSFFCQSKLGLLIYTKTIDGSHSSPPSSSPSSIATDPSFRVAPSNQKRYLIHFYNFPARQIQERKNGYDQVICLRSHNMTERQWLFFSFFFLALVIILLSGTVEYHHHNSIMITMTTIG